MSKELTIVSLRQYAKDKNVSDTYIRKIRGKRLGEHCFGMNEKNGRPFLYKELADVDWVNNYDPAHDNKFKANKNKSESSTEEKKEKTTTKTQSAFSEQRAKREAVEYHLSAIRLQEKRGELVLKSKVFEVLFSFASEIRNAFQDLPDKNLDNILAAGAEGNRDAAYDIYTAGIESVLAKLTNIDQAVKI